MSKFFLLPFSIQFDSDSLYLVILQCKPEILKLTGKTLLFDGVDLGHSEARRCIQAL